MRIFYVRTIVGTLVRFEVRHDSLHKVNRIFSYIGFYFAKAGENFSREGEGSERTDLKKMASL